MHQRISKAKVLQETNPNTAFSLYARALHWSIALLVIGLFVLGLWMRSLGYYHPWYQTAPDLHTSFGIIFLILVVLRIIWRTTTTPPTPLGDSRAEHALAAIVHKFLYVLMIAMAITGYLYASADGKAASVFYLFDIPVLIHSKFLADQISDLHEWLAYAIIALTVLHVIGALKHHIVDRDATLLRMITSDVSQTKTKEQTQ